MRRLLILMVLAGVVAAVVGAPASAGAASCPSEQSVMTSSSNSQYASSGYICAQEDHTGDNSIGAGKTHSWSPATNADYFPWYYCFNTSTSAVTVSHAQTWGSASFTATNSLTAPNTRDWAAAVLWTLENVTPSGFNGGCTYKGSTTWSHPPAILRISSVSYSGLPATAVAGTRYPISVTVSPSSATGTVVLQDKGVAVASAVLSGGKATINWVPAVDGTSSVTIAYAGDSANTPAMNPNTKNGAKPISIPVSGGVGVAITSASSAGATVTVTPATQAGTIKLLDATSKTLRGLVPLSGTGTTTFPFAYAANTSYNLIAIVTDPTGANVGQSYPYAWKSNGASPASRATTLSVAGVPTAATAGSSYPITVTAAPATATGTVVLQDAGTAIASATLANGTATFNWIPAVDGTSRLTVLYMGDATNPFASTAPSSSCAATSTAPAATYCVAVTGGTGLAITGITATSATAGSATVAVTPSTWSGQVLLIDASTQKPIGQGSASNGTATISFPYTAGTSYTLVAKVKTSTASGQSYPVTWSSTAGLSRRAGGATRLPDVGVVPTPAAQARFGEILETLEHEEGSGADPALQLRVVDRVTTGNRPFDIKCPAGQRVINADAMTSGPVDEIEIGSYTKTGVRVVPSPADRGHRVMAQLLCRPAGARAVVHGQVAYGTVLPNEIRLVDKQNTAFGGPGPDLLTARIKGAALWGGLGHDIILLDGAKGTAAGGPGGDTIVGGGTGSHVLVGGFGRDSITSSFGPDLINARDGRPGDVVTCRNPRVRVMADAGDVVSGPCVQVDTANGEATVAG